MELDENLMKSKIANTCECHVNAVTLQRNLDYMILQCICTWKLQREHRSPGTQWLQSIP